MPKARAAGARCRRGVLRVPKVRGATSRCQSRPPVASLSSACRARKLRSSSSHPFVSRNLRKSSRATWIRASVRRSSCSTRAGQLSAMSVTCSSSARKNRRPIACRPSRSCQRRQVSVGSQCQAAESAAIVWASESSGWVGEVVSTASRGPRVELSQQASTSGPLLAHCNRTSQRRGSVSRSRCVARRWSVARQSSGCSCSTNRIAESSPRVTRVARVASVESAVMPSEWMVRRVSVCGDESKPSARASARRPAAEVALARSVCAARVVSMARR